MKKYNHLKVSCSIPTELRCQINRFPSSFSFFVLTCVEELVYWLYFHTALSDHPDKLSQLQPLFSILLKSYKSLVLDGTPLPKKVF